MPLESFSNPVFGSDWALENFSNPVFGLRRCILNYRLTYQSKERRGENEKSCVGVGVLAGAMAGACLACPDYKDENRSCDDNSSNRCSYLCASQDYFETTVVSGSRSKSGVHRVFMQNVASLRYAYNRRVRANPDLYGGMIRVKLAVDESGNVILAQIIEGEYPKSCPKINDTEFENTVIERVKNWKFGQIDVSGDVTEVIYPFSFWPVE